MTQQDYPITPSGWHPRRVVVTGYYDGPTEGVIDFGGDIGVYCFKAVAFDFDRQVRVLKLARVTSAQLESLLTTLSSTLGPQRWPFWVPMWSFSDENAKRTTEDALDAFCAHSELVAVVLTDDSLEKCFAVRKIDKHSKVASDDWMSLFV